MQPVHLLVVERDADWSQWSRISRSFGTTVVMLIQRADEIDPAWLNGVTTLGLTAGASAPEILVRGLIDRLCSLGATGVSEIEGISEGVVFPLPKALA